MLNFEKPDLIQINQRLEDQIVGQLVLFYNLQIIFQKKENQEILGKIHKPEKERKQSKEKRYEIELGLY